MENEKNVKNAYCMKKNYETIYKRLLQLLYGQRQSWNAGERRRCLWPGIAQTLHTPLQSENWWIPNEI